MKILICEDHKMYIDGLRRAIEQVAGVTLVSEARDGIEAMKLLNVEKYDVVLMDIKLPGKSGLQLLEEIKQKWPSTHVLMVSQYEEKNYALRAINLGASGYLNKNSGPAELVKAINMAMNNEIYRSKWLQEFLGNENDIGKIKHLHDLLTKREFPILRMLGEGKSTKEIAEDLAISEKTVSVHKSHIMDKMKFTTDYELEKYCHENGLL